MIAYSIRSIASCSEMQHTVIATEPKLREIVTVRTRSFSVTKRELHKVHKTIRYVRYTTDMIFDFR